MFTPSDEVTKTWLKQKGILVKNRPEPSRFSFVVCLTIVASIGLGFLGGFVTAGIALNDNYSSIYENLLSELENTKRCVEREKEKLILKNKNPQANDDALDLAHVKNVTENKPLIKVDGNM